MSYNNRRNSGLDFMDRGLPEPAGPKGIDAHPDLVIDAQALSKPNLQRNKTERRRIQGLLSSDAKPVAAKPHSERNVKEKWASWMVNEGGKRIFFFTFILLHILVLIFGFFNYQLKDNLNNARATFGITYRMFAVNSICYASHTSQLSPVLRPWFSTSMSHSSCSPSAAISSPFSVALP